MKRLIALLLLSSFGTAAIAWSYDVKTDKMTSKQTSFAYLQSKNSLNLGFPYQGRNMGSLTVRQHPQHGLDVIFSVEKGQLICSSYSGCDLLVRFDDKPPTRFAGTEPASNDHETIFVNNAKRFIAEAKKAKKILVQVEMYKAGGQILEFEVSSPLVWPPK